jgi:putative hemolysin
MSRAGRWWLVLLAGLLAAALGPGRAAAVPNPATSYCRDLGYDWVPRRTAAGVVGMCVLPDGAAVEEWAFLTGQVATEWGYCARAGHATALLRDRRQCHAVFVRDCAACVLPDGRAIEASTLMARGGATAVMAVTPAAAVAAPDDPRGGCGVGAPSTAGLGLALALLLLRPRRRRDP